MPKVIQGRILGKPPQKGLAGVPKGNPQTPDPESKRNKEVDEGYVTPQRIAMPPTEEAVTERTTESESDSTHCTQEPRDEVVLAPERPLERKLELTRGQLKEGTWQEGYWAYVNVKEEKD